MSADAFIVFYGLRFDLGNREDETADEDAINLLNADEHPLVESARKVGLDSYWGNFEPDTQHYLLFIGKHLGIFGWENESEMAISDQELNAVINEVRDKLRQAQFDDEPRLWIQFEPDF